MAKVLIVDDLEPNVRLMSRWLISRGFQIVSAADGDAAFATALRDRPDLVVLDLMMPAPNGFDVCEKLKGNPFTRQIPIIVVTGLQHPANIAHARQLGADAVLVKPLDEALFVGTLGRVLGSRVP